MSYQESIHDLVKELPINNCSFLITGATGLIGSCIIDTLLYANVKGANFKIYAMSRSRKKVMEKFGDKVSVYGPTMLKSDSKAHGQFIKNALNKENIVLKSKGEQRRTYSYVVDVVSGIFKVLFNGLNGEIYNVANENSIASIAEVASICAEIAGTKVVFDLPDKIEKKGFSQSKDCILDNSKLKSLGWNGKYTLKQGLVETIESLREDK